MKKVLMGAAALAMMVPGAAMAAHRWRSGGDEHGSFSATLNVQPPTGVTVQVVGLDDFDFGTVNHDTNTAGTNVSGLGQRFCLLRSDAGDVRVNIVQTNLPAGQNFSLQGSIDSNLDGTVDSVAVAVTVFSPTGASGIGMSNNSPVNVPQSGPGCTTGTSSFSIAHDLTIEPTTLPDANTLRLAGAYTAQFTMTVSVP
jgi:hypothetical protein